MTAACYGRTKESRRGPEISPNTIPTEAGLDGEHRPQNSTRLPPHRPDSAADGAGNSDLTLDTKSGPESPRRNRSRCTGLKVNELGEHCPLSGVFRNTIKSVWRVVKVVGATVEGKNGRNSSCRLSCFCRH